MTPTTLYGIPNCDTMKRARQWLDGAQIDYHFHDFRKHGIDTTTLQQWLRQVDWRLLLNRRGTTWRKLDATRQQSIDEDNVCELLCQQPSMIKRPVLDHTKGLEIGFNATTYEQIFNSNNG